MPTIYKTIEGFVSRYLQPVRFDASKDKHIHDPIWGGIRLSPPEQVLLDTPLLQRLRQIHQTGCVYATYPSAVHTRFEHTLGVMHTAGRMADSLRLKHPKLVTNSVSVTVRLAALMHDTGHSAFSHTTEEIYRECADLKKLIGTRGRFEGKGAGEVLSYLIATSNAFREVFEQLKRKYSDRLAGVNVDDFASLIVGRPPLSRPTHYFEANIISGPVDADKLDYFPRDGRSAGLSVTLDADRLLNCIEIAKMAKNQRTGHYLIINRGGFNALQQLLFARATLFSTVYHHHKVRACDCQIKGVFEYMRGKNLPFKTTASRRKGYRMKSAADFLNVTDADFFAEADRHKCGTIQHRLIHGLLYRRLFKRVLIISKRTVAGLENIHSPEVQHVAQGAYGTFFNLRSRPAKLREFALEIYRRAAVQCGVHEVWIDIPSAPTFNKAGEALMRASPLKQPLRVESLSTYIPIKEWISTYEQYSCQSYLFGPADEKSRISLAIVGRALLEEEFGLKLNDSAIPDDIRQKVGSYSGKSQRYSNPGTSRVGNPKKKAGK